MNKNLILILLIFFVFTVNSFAQLEIVSGGREEYIQKVAQLFKENKSEEAKSLLDKGLIKYPEDSDLKGLHGKYYLQQKNYDKARYELLEALKYNPRNASAKQSLINVEMATKRFSSAISYINDLLELMPYDKDLWLKKAEAYRLQGNIVESNRLLKRIYNIYPNDNILKNNVLDYITEEFYAKKGKVPISELENLAFYIIDEDPQNEDVLINLINSYIQIGDFEKALIYAERGVFTMPDNITIIKKKNSILAHLNKYQEILSSLKDLMRTTQKKLDLQKEYDYYLEEAAQYSKNSDVYHLYNTLFQKNPRNIEYFNQVYTIGLSRGLFDDVTEAIKLAKKQRGETNELLLKELYLYERMGNESKTKQMVEYISNRYPSDKEIKYKKCAINYAEAKHYISDRLFDKAIVNLNYVENNGDEEFIKLALRAKYNCFFELKKIEKAEYVLNKLINIEPQEAIWRFNKSILLGVKEKYIEALNEYVEGINLTEKAGYDIDGVMIGYDEQVASYVKILIEKYSFDEALELIDLWLVTNPKSKDALRYGYNLSSQMNKSDKLKEYLNKAILYYPSELYFQLKLADFYTSEKEFELALDIILPLLKKYPYHKDIISTYSTLSLYSAKKSMKDTNVKEGLDILNGALAYDPKNLDLKYIKGIAFEKLHQLDSAIYYQSFYNPTPIELKDYEKHIQYLKYISKKNEVSFYMNSYRFSDVDAITSIAGVEYLRINKNNTYSGRFYYSGRETDKGLMAQGEWNHRISTKWSTMFHALVGCKVFPKFGVTATTYYSFIPTWEAEMTAGFRSLADSKDMMNLQVGLSKEFEFARFTTRFNSIILDEKWYYNLFGQSRFFISDRRNYITAMASLGSAPDIEVLDNQFYSAYDVTNVMVAIGGYFILSEFFSLYPIGTWYNYKVDNEVYKSLYSLQLKFNIRF